MVYNFILKLGSNIPTCFQHFLSQSDSDPALYLVRRSFQDTIPVLEWGKCLSRSRRHVTQGLLSVSNHVVLILMPEENWS